MKPRYWLGMSFPTATDWSFAHIRSQDADRVRQLELADSKELLQQLGAALVTAFRSDAVRFAIDSDQNRFQICRPTVQFPAPPRIVDAFFNARTGYRAHFWMSPSDGLAFNASLVALLSSCLERHFPEQVLARKIEIRMEGESRCEIDVGSIEVSKLRILQALDPHVSKVWLCERLVQRDGSPPKDTSLLLSSVMSAKLGIPKWEAAKHPATGEIGEGVRAPYPNADQAWFDIKGGFFDGSRVYQLKDPLKRAQELHECGWT